MAAEGQRRRPRPLSIASSLVFIVFIVLFGAAVVAAPRCFADAKSTSTTRSRVPYSEPTPAEGGKVVHYNLTLGVAKRAPDCYREFWEAVVLGFFFRFYWRRCFLFFAQLFFLEKPETKKKLKKVRDVYTINGQFGGPTLEVHRGDVLHVTLVNEVPADYPQV